MTHEPYDEKENDKGYKARQIVKGELPNPGFVELQRDYFVPAREWHIDEKIMPAMQEGKMVVSDRYFESTLVYAKTSGNIPYAESLAWHEECIYPTLTIVVDISAEESIRRHELEITARGTDGDIFDEEGVEKQAARRAVYLELAEIGKPYMPNAEVVDGEQGRKDVLLDVLGVTSKHLGNNAVMILAITLM